jgi:hypothetical protein
MRKLHRGVSISIRANLIHINNAPNSSGITFHS